MFGILFKEACSAVASNKSRTFLTLLGIVIGIASVITVIAAGDGGKLIILQEFEGLSPTTVQVLPNFRDLYTNSLYRMELLEPKDLDDMQKYIPEIENLAPIQTMTTIIKVGDKQKKLTITGSNNNYIDLVGFNLKAGRRITDYEVDFLSKVAIIGSGIAEEFFPGQNPIGQYLIALDTPVQIIGILEEKQKSETISIFDSESTYNNMIIVPVGVFRRMFGNRGGYFAVLAKVKSLAVIPDVKRKIMQVLNRNHGQWGDKIPKFMVMGMQEQIDMINNIIGTITTGVAVLAGIALVVATISIMNIMLVSVKERTREIGIRKATGAERGHIMLQFLIETLLLCGGGGLIGLGIAFLASYLIGALAKWPAIIDPGTCLLAILLSLVTGLLSGLYPASRASKLPPQEALRYE